MTAAPAGKHVTSTDEGEIRGGKDGCTGGGRGGDNEACEGCAGLHRGLRDRRAACSRLRDDVAQGVGGSTGEGRRREHFPSRSFFFDGNVADSFNVSMNGGSTTKRQRKYVKAMSAIAC